jgi:glycosyltransferase involved in cell wall biosynthesis
MVAQVVPWKRQDLYISAAGALASKYPFVSFLHVGTDMSGYNSDYFHQLKLRVRESGLQERFQFADFADDIQPVLTCCDILVLPSEQEPFGRVVVEAWLAGKPVIVSDCGGPAELVTHGINGLVFASGNAAELAASMEELSQDAPLRHRLGAAGRAKAGQFSADYHTRDICRVYERLLA